MPTLSSFLSATYAAASTFMKEFLRSYPDTGPAPAGARYSFGDRTARMGRYELYWAMWENTPYDNVHAWSAQYKHAYSLYKAIRGVYSPAGRLGEFWATHLMGGDLDPAAGDGKDRPSALPIITKNEAVRRPIARVWRDSKWQDNKTVVSRLGAVLGDAPTKVCNDEERGRIILEVVHPSSLPWVARDSRGNVRGYVQEEWRPNPDFDPREPEHPERNPEKVRYREVCVKTDSGVQYSTYRGNGGDFYYYDWRGGGLYDAVWEAEYPFVPLVIAPHIKADPYEAWGLSEYHGLVHKNNDLNDVGSMLHDQIRKTVKGAWLMAGVDRPKPDEDGNRSLSFGSRPSSDSRPDPERQDIPIIWAGIGATATPLVLPLDVQFTSIELQNQLENIERDYPELSFMKIRMSGDASAKAIQEGRKPAEAKVHARRVPHDDAHMRALQMAIAIGGEWGHDEFEGFDFSSYDSGLLDFSIGHRPVFAMDETDRLGDQRAMWEVGAIAIQQGYPIERFLRDQGYTDQQLEEFRTQRQAELDLQVEQARRIAEVQAMAGAMAQAAMAPPAEVAAA